MVECVVKCGVLDGWFSSLRGDRPFVFSGQGLDASRVCVHNYPIWKLSRMNRNSFLANPVGFIRVTGLETSGSRPGLNRRIKTAGSNPTGLRRRRRGRRAGGEREVPAHSGCRGGGHRRAWVLQLSCKCDCQESRGGGRHDLPLLQEQGRGSANGDRYDVR